MKPDIKYYLIPAVILVIIIILILILPFNSNRSTTPSSPTNIPPLSITRMPTKTLLPTPLPPENSTGAIPNQELPSDIQNLGIQKTEFRMKTPITLSFGTILFDYQTDLFLVKLSEPKEQNKVLFQEWLAQSYPAIPLDRFAFE